MNKRAALWAALLAGVVITGAPKAGGLKDDLNDFIDDIGGAANSTGASLYKGQSRTYLNGGRLFVRTPARTVKQLVTFTEPSVKAGCSGIDVYTGGMSFVDGDELVETLEDSVASAGSYLFLIGLRAITPQIANTMEKVQTWANEHLGQNYNSCHMAARAANSIASMSLQSEKDSVCVMQRMENNNEDYSTATKNCSNSGGNKRTNTLKNDQAKKQQFYVGNLVWMVMHKNDMFTGKDNRQMREMMMSITGTITKSLTDGKTEHHLSQLTVDDKLLDAILNGGSAKLYQCDGTWSEINNESGCQSLTDSGQTITIAKADSLYAKAQNAMDGIYNAIRNRTDPADADIEYVTATGVPMNKVLTVSAAMGGSVGPQLIDKYAELAAFDMLYGYITRLLDAMEAEISGELALGKNEVEYMRHSVRLVRERLREKAMEVRRKFDSALNMAQELQHYETILISAIPERLGNSYQWGMSF